ncbi:MAG: ATP-dependent Clp protease adaptor protein ClpS [Parasphingorhabdus sp.]|jgi:ATP-dependent Clp protease adaptor protein ClpS
MSDSKEIQKTGDTSLQEAKPKVKKPRMYKVMLMNDDYTPMDFVVAVLERYFRKTREQAVEIMLTVHNKGSGLCGVFAYEVAETKIQLVLGFAQENQHPLQCTMEPE